MIQGTEKSTRQHQQFERLSKYLNENAGFSHLAVFLPQLTNDIFALLPRTQYFSKRLLNKRCRRLIDLSLINADTVQDGMQHLVKNEYDQNAVFLVQQQEVQDLIANKRAILNTPKWESQVVRPDEELVQAFKEIEALPADNSLFSLYRRHLCLDNMNLHIILNSRDHNQLFNMMLDSLVVDLSGLHLTRLPSCFMDMFLNKGFFSKTKVFSIANNHLTTLPRSIVRFTGLRVLDVSGNKITSLPCNINHFEFLETVLLAINDLTTLPEGLVKLRNLKYVDVRRNRLKKIPIELESGKLARPVDSPQEFIDTNTTFEMYQLFMRMHVLKKEMVLATQKPSTHEMEILAEKLRSLTV